MRHALTTTALLVTTLLTACTTTSSSETTTTTKPAKTTTPSPTPTRNTYTLGEPWAWESDTGTSGTTTALTYTQPIHSVGSANDEAGITGYVWAALEVKICNDATSPEPIDTSDTEWTLAYDDGSSIESTSSGYSDFPRPQFPMGGATVKSGRCLRGKIVFPVPGKTRPVRAVYGPYGLADPVEWEIPAK